MDPAAIDDEEAALLVHHALIDARRWVRMRGLRGWVRWRRQPSWIKAATLVPAIIATVALFVISGFLIAALFGVTFVLPWIGGLPLVTALFLRSQLARGALFIFERMGLGVVINKAVDWVIDIVWWRTPEPMQRRFDAWWRWFKMRLRRRVIGPRRKIAKRMADFRRQPAAPEPPPITEVEPSGGQRAVSTSELGDTQEPNDTKKPQA